jgi:hypothetical protein
VIIGTIGFGETEHDRIKGRNPIQILREEYCAGA